MKAQKFLTVGLVLALGMGLARGQSGVTPSLPMQTVVIASGAGTITNVAWQSNTRYVLDGGTNTVSTFPLAQGAPHMLIRDRTNIVIQGLGWNSVVKSYQTGVVFEVFNCRGITFKDFTISGTRGPETGFNMPSQFAAICEMGTNYDLRYEGLYIVDQSNQGISGCLDGDLSYTSNSIISKCVFERVGTSNVTQFLPGGDGAGIVACGSHITVEKCHFKYCYRDFEPFSWHSASQRSLNGLKFRGNSSIGCKERAIDGLITGMRDLDISDNTIVYDSTRIDGAFDLHRGIDLSECRDVRIVNNSIQYGEYGITIAASSANHLCVNGVISGNAIANNVRGLYLTATSGTNAGWLVEGNVFSYQWGAAINFNGIGHRIINNQFNRNNWNSGGQATIIGQAWGGITGSNTISGNTFWSDNSLVANSSAYCVSLASGINWTMVTRNQFGDYTTAPYLDSGNNNVWIQNTMKDNLIQEQPAASVNQTATAANTTETDLVAYTIPAYTFAGTNQSVDVSAWGSFGATANNKDVRVKFGGATTSNQLLDTLLRANNAQEWMLSGTIQWLNATTMKTAFRFETAGFVTNDIATLTIGATTNIILRVTGSNTVAAASDIVLEGWKVRWSP